MKAYVLRPMIEVFDGSGSLGADAARTLRLLAEVVADTLRGDGDNSHQAAVWEGPANVDARPTFVTLPDRQSLADLAFRLLNPNDLIGGDIRSVANCRTATFGQDGQAMLALMHEDAVRMPNDGSLFSINDCSEWLTTTDLFDGSWPTA